MTETMALDHLSDVDIVDNVEPQVIEVQTNTKVIFKTGLPNSVHHIDEEDLQSLYHSFGISSEQINKRFSIWRLDVIHIRGVQDMSSEDVLKYLDDFEPKSIEWVNDLSCNVVFEDRKASATALKSLTTALVIKPNCPKTTESLAFDVIDAESLSVPIPPTFRWGLGISHSKSKALLLRFATNSDKKTVNAKPDLRLSVTNHSNDIKRNLGDNSDQFNIKAKRFRMRADEEEEQRTMVKQRIAPRAKLAKSDKSNGRSIWDRLDSNSSKKFCPPDSHMIKVSIDNTTDWSDTDLSEPPLRSTISVVERTGSAVKTTHRDLRSRIRRKL